MQPVFVSHYATNQTRFDWPQDGHWNPLGHELCFDELARSALLERVFSVVRQFDPGAWGIIGVANGPSRGADGERAIPSPSKLKEPVLD